MAVWEAPAIRLKTDLQSRYRRGAAFAAPLLLLLILGPWIREAHAIDAFGEVGVKKLWKSEVRLRSDTLQGGRGRISPSEFEQAFTDQVGATSVQWMLPVKSECREVGDRAGREVAIAGFRRWVDTLDVFGSVEIKVTAYLSPVLVRFKMKSTFDLSADPVHLIFGMGAPCNSPTSAADLLSVLVHELAHVKVWGSTHRVDRYTNEFVAHIVQTAAWVSMTEHHPGPSEWPFRNAENSFPMSAAELSEIRPVSVRAGHLAQSVIAQLLGPDEFTCASEPGKCTRLNELATCLVDSVDDLDIAGADEELESVLENACFGALAR